MPCVGSRTSARIRTLFRLCRTLRHGQFLARMVQAENWLYSTMVMQVTCSPMTALIRTWSPGLGLRQCGNCEKLADGLRLGLGVARWLSWSPSLSRFGWSRCRPLYCLGVADGLRRFIWLFKAVLSVTGTFTAFSRSGCLWAFWCVVRS